MGDTMATDASVKPALLSRTDELADGGTDPPVWLAELIGAVHVGDIGEGSGSVSTVALPVLPFKGALLVNSDPFNGGPEE